jgi:hypothetical protein
MSAMAADMTPKSVVDPTDADAKSYASDSYSESSLALNKFDTIPIALGIVAVIICLAVGLSVFFTLKAQEYKNAQDNLTGVAVEGAVALQKALDNLISTVQIFRAYFDVSKPSIPSYLTQSVPFMNATGTFPEFVRSVSYLPLVTEANRVAFINATRALAGSIPYYKTFNFTARGKQTINCEILLCRRCQ